MVPISRLIEPAALEELLMQEDTAPLLEAIRCELLCVQQRLETRESPSPAAAGRRDIACPVPLLAVPADLAVPRPTAERVDHQVPLTVMAETAPRRVPAR